MLLFLTTNMAAVKSIANQQWVEMDDGVNIHWNVSLISGHIRVIYQ